jgi:hypothetical protein
VGILGIKDAAKIINRVHRRMREYPIHYRLQND